MLKLFIKFSLVGASGIVVNLGVYSLLIAMKTNYLWAAVISFAFAVTNNFYWNFIWTFKGKGEDKSAATKYLYFWLISLLNFGFNLLILRELVDVLLLNKVLAQLIAILIVSTSNFLGNYLFTFKTNGSKAEQTITKKGDITNENSNHHSYLQ